MLHSQTYCQGDWSMRFDNIICNFTRTCWESYTNIHSQSKVWTHLDIHVFFIFIIFYIVDHY